MRLASRFTGLVLATAAIGCIAQNPTCPAGAAYQPGSPLPGTEVIFYQNVGLQFVNNGCPVQARKAFQQELMASKSLAGSAPQVYAAMIGTFFDLTSAMDAWEAGDYPTATTFFAKTSSAGMPQATQGAAIPLFSRFMLTHFDAATWPGLKSQLEFWDTENFVLARYYLTFIGLSPANGVSRIAELQALLQKNLPEEMRLDDEMILADLLLQVNRVPEADLLTHSIEKDVGDEVWNNDLRLYYLDVCARIATVQAQSGNPQYAARAAVYTNAVRTFNVPKP